AIVECVVPGAGAVEILAHRELGKFVHEVKGRARLGVQAFANALLVIPKVLAANAGHDTQETMVKLLEEAAKVEKRCCGNPAAELVGVDLATGEAMIPAQMGVYDNFVVKKQIISSWSPSLLRIFCLWTKLCGLDSVHSRDSLF
ncbi:T-complex protein 1 subunit zeta, partial [Paragonimus westermani]